MKERITTDAKTGNKSATCQVASLAKTASKYYDDYIGSGEEQHLEHSEAIMAMITSAEMKQNVLNLSSCSVFYIIKWLPFILVLFLLGD